MVTLASGFYHYSCSLHNTYLRTASFFPRYFNHQFAGYISGYFGHDFRQAGYCWQDKKSLVALQYLV
jgi:hypothetical protein